MVENNQKNQNAIIPVTSKKTGKTSQHQSEMQPKSSNTPLGKKFLNTFGRIESEEPQDWKTKNEAKHYSSSVAKDKAETSLKYDKDKKKEPESFEDFIKLFYSGKTKSLPEKLARKLNDKTLAQPDISPSLIENCLKYDSSLEKTRQLLILTLNLKRFTKLERALRNALRTIIFAHPDMTNQSLDDWFPFSGITQPKNISDLRHEFVFKAQTNNPNSPKDKSEKKAEDKKSSPVDPQKSRRNAYISAIVWRYAERYIKFPELIRELRSTIFIPPAAKEEIETKSLECLTTSQDGKDRDRISALITWFSDQSDGLRSQVEQHRRKADTLQELLDQSRDLIAAKESEISKFKSEIDDLRAQLYAAQENTRVQGIHLRDDQQKQRGRILRALEEEVPMLQDTLKALERDPPKVNVAKDYLARVLDNLNNELKHLRGN